MFQEFGAHSPVPYAPGRCANWGVHGRPLLSVPQKALAADAVPEQALYLWVTGLPLFECN